MIKDAAKKIKWKFARYQLNLLSSKKKTKKLNQPKIKRNFNSKLFSSKKQKARIYASKAQLNSVIMQMKNQLCN